MTTIEKIKAIAETLDASGRPAAPITVRSRREYLMRIGLKPEKRGGPILVGAHHVICGYGKQA